MLGDCGVCMWAVGAETVYMWMLNETCEHSVATSMSVISNPLAEVLRPTNCPVLNNNLKSSSRPRDGDQQGIKQPD